MKIRTLSDAFWRRLLRATKGCRLIVIAGVGLLPSEQIADVLLAVCTFTEFSPDNDPHGEHDFRAIEYTSVRYFWKIDAYDQSMQLASNKIPMYETIKQ